MCPSLLTFLAFPFSPTVPSLWPVLSCLASFPFCLQCLLPMYCHPSLSLSLTLYFLHLSTMLVFSPWTPVTDRLGLNFPCIPAVNTTSQLLSPPHLSSAPGPNPSPLLGPQKECLTILRRAVDVQWSHLALPSVQQDM